MLILLPVALSLLWLLQVGAAPTMIINEIASQALGGVPHDWIELSVTGEVGETLDTGAFQIADDGHAAMPICNQNFTLTVGDYLMVEFNKKSSNTCHYPYKLGSCDHVELLYAGAVASQYDYCREDSPRGDAYSFSRIPDITGSFVLGTPTPGKANVVAPTGTPPGTVQASVFGSDEVLSMFLTMNATLWEAMSTLALDYVHADLSLQVESSWLTANWIGVRAKGQSSLRQMFGSRACRWPLKIKVNEFKGSQRLGSERLQKIVLNPAFSDESMNLREWLGYKLYANFELVAPRTRFANLHVNGQLVGLYLLVEAVDTDNFLRMHYPGHSKDATMYKPELHGLTCASGGGMALSSMRMSTSGSCPWPPTPMQDCREANQSGSDSNERSQAAPGQRLPGREPGQLPPGFEPGQPQQNQGQAQGNATCEEQIESGFGVQKGNNHSHIVALAKLLDDKWTPSAELYPYLNKTMWLRYLVVTVAIGHFDSLIGGMDQNYYLFDPGFTGHFEPLTWDLNMAFGGFPGCDCGNGGQFFTKINVTAGCGGTSIISGHLLRDESFFAAYVDVMSNFVATAFSASRTVPELNRMAALIRPSVQLDPTRSTSLSSFDETVNTTSTPLSDNDVRLTVPTVNGSPPHALGRWLQLRPVVLQAEISAYLNGSPNPSSTTEQTPSPMRNKSSCDMLDPAHIGIKQQSQLQPRQVPICTTTTRTAMQTIEGDKIARTTSSSAISMSFRPTNSVTHLTLIALFVAGFVFPDRS